MICDVAVSNWSVVILPRILASQTASRGVLVVGKVIWRGDERDQIEMLMKVIGFVKEALREK
jgi:hypothetical protein